MSEQARHSRLSSPPSRFGSINIGPDEVRMRQQA
jgi:hypothetical protein